MHRCVPSVVLAALVASVVSADAQVIREIAYQERVVMPVHARVRYTTLIVLPEDDVIQEALCGDPDFWIINVRGNRASIKPAKSGGASVLHLISPSRRIYTFALQETAEQSADVGLFVTAPPLVPSGAASGFVPADEVAQLRAQLDDAQAAATTAQQTATQTVDAFRTDYPTQLRFDYVFSPRQRPFNVNAVWHDGRFTYIKSRAQELPALYEQRDGRATLVNFTVRDGTYVIPHVVERGYLMLGDKRWLFRLAAY